MKWSASQRTWRIGMVLPVGGEAGEGSDGGALLGFRQRLARDRLGVEADVLPGGHLIALAQPEAMARYLLTA